MRKKLVLKLLDRPNHLLSTLLIGNNLVNIGIIILSTFIINKYFTANNDQLTTILVLLILTPIVLLFGEIAPKVFATRNNVQCQCTSGYELNNDQVSCSGKLYMCLIVCVRKYVFVY